MAYLSWTDIFMICVNFLEVFLLFILIAALGRLWTTIRSAIELRDALRKYTDLQEAALAFEARQAAWRSDWTTQDVVQEPPR